MRTPSQRPLPAHRPLFPLAAAFALAAAPLWLALHAAHPGTDFVLWHGHEMLCRDNHAAQPQYAA